MNPLQWGTPSRSKQGYAALTKEIIMYLVPEVVALPYETKKKKLNTFLKKLSVYE